MTNGDSTAGKDNFMIVIKESSKVVKGHSNPKWRSLRAGIPQSIVKALELADGDTLVWKVRPGQGAFVVEIEKESVKETAKA